MTVIKFPSSRREENIDDVKRGLETGVYLEAMIAVLCADGTVKQIEIRQPWIDRLAESRSV